MAIFRIFHLCQYIPSMFIFIQFVWALKLERRGNSTVAQFPWSANPSNCLAFVVLSFPSSSPSSFLLSSTWWCASVATGRNCLLLGRHASERVHPDASLAIDPRSSISYRGDLLSPRVLMRLTAAPLPSYPLSWSPLSAFCLCSNFECLSRFPSVPPFVRLCVSIYVSGSQKHSWYLHCFKVVIVRKAPTCGRPQQFAEYDEFNGYAFWRIHNQSHERFRHRQTHRQTDQRIHTQTHRYTKTHRSTSKTCPKTVWTRVLDNHR